jgi:hypothetical protein
MKTKLLAMALMAGSTMFAGVRFGIGVNVGIPAPVAVSAYRPPCPGPGYIWVDAYQDEYGNWVGGYWAMPPYDGAYWVAPSYAGGRFAAGYWGGVRHVDRDDFRHFDRDDFRGAHDFRRDVRPPVRNDFHNDHRDFRNDGHNDRHDFRR